MITEIHITGDELNALNKKVGGIHMPKQMTEQEYIQTCNTEQLVEELLAWWFDGANTYSEFGLYSREIDEAKEKIVEWLKQPHTNESSK